MNQADLIARLSESKDGGNLSQCKRIVKSVFEILKGALLEEGEVVLPELGKLKVVRRPTRTGRNPYTGDSIEVPAKSVVKFRPSRELKAAAQPLDLRPSVDA